MTKLDKPHWQEFQRLILTLPVNEQQFQSGLYFSLQGEDYKGHGYVHHVAPTTWHVEVEHKASMMCNDIECVLHFFRPYQLGDFFKWSPKEGEYVELIYDSNQQRYIEPSTYYYYY
jgi:hypothetical protein